MNAYKFPHAFFSRCPLAALVLACFVAGCSGSSDAGSDSVGSATVTDSSETPDSNISSSDGFDTADMPDTDSTESEGVEAANTEVDGTETDVDTTRVNFNIQVPAYASDELQVRLTWGEIDTTAAWLRDESWFVSENFPAGEENILTVTFADRNGRLTLASYQNLFTVDGENSQEVDISPADFDTVRWDDDNDGVSNFDELIAGGDPLAANESSNAPPPESFQAALELRADKTFRISWEPVVNAQFYRVLENPDGESGYTAVADRLDSSFLQYDHRVALYARFDASYIVQACNTIGCSDSDELTLPSSLSPAVGYFKASNAEASDRFGSRVSLSSDGNSMAITGGDVVYVFARLNDQWQQEAIIEETEVTGGGGFGKALVMSSDGNLLVIGSPEEPSISTGGLAAQFEPATADAGAVYVFQRTADGWQQQARIVSNNIEAQDDFGISVSLNSAATLLAVGAEGEKSASVGINGDASDNSLVNSGAVYVFELSDGDWQQQSYIKASNPQSGDHFGGALSFNDDGDTLVVGSRWQFAPGDDATNDGGTSGGGAAYVFVRSNTAWQQQAFLKADDPDEGDNFGAAVSVDASGNTLAVGAPLFNLGAGSTSTFAPTGAVYLFTRTNETWQQQRRLNSDIQGDRFGGAIELTRDGRTIAIGAVGANDRDGSPQNTGAVQVYGQDSGEWFLQTQLNAGNAQASDRFGESLSFSADGNSLAIGAGSESSAATGINGDQSDNSSQSSGAVYLY